MQIYQKGLLKKSVICYLKLKNQKLI